MQLNIFSGKISLHTIEKLLFFLTLGSMLIPLSINILVIQLYIWNIPFFFIGILYLIKIFKKPVVKISSDHWTISCVILITTLFIYTVTGDNLNITWPFFTQFITSIIFAVYVKNVWGNIITEKSLIKFSIIALFFQSVIGFIQQLTGSQFGNIKSYFGDVIEKEISTLDPTISLSRVMGTLDQPNIFGNWIIILFPFVILGIYNRRYINNRYLVIGIISILFSLICLPFTFSIGNIGIFSILSLVFIFINIFKKLPSNLLKVNKLTILFYILFIFVTSFGILKYHDKIDIFKKAVEYRISLKSDDTSTAATSFRMEMNLAAMKHFKKYPLAGMGYNNSIHVYDKVQSKIPFWWEKRVHNIYLAILVEGGLIAMLAYICFSFLPIIRIISSGMENIQYAFLFSLISCIGFIQIYLTPTAPEFAPLYSLIVGSAIGFSTLSSTTFE